MEKLYPFIEYRNGCLYMEDVNLKELAQKLDTPTYVYGKSAITYWFKEFDKAFEEIEHLTCFAVKSCSNINILALLKELGAGADTVSKGEIFRSLTAGIPARKIVFAGVGKRKDEIEYALQKGILLINVESEGELLAVEEIAQKLNKKARISFRVNPEVDPKTHPYISTGLKTSKFGISYEEAIKLYQKAKNLKMIEPLGIHFHIGSQITDVSTFKEAAEKIAIIVKELNSLGIEIEFFDAGGGLGINYHPKEDVVPTEKLAKALIPIVKKLGCKLILEPGRRIVGNAGILLTKILYVKERDNKTFYIVDAGMNDLFRPSLYKAYHHIVPVEKKETELIDVDIVGPICETGDIFAERRKMPKLKEGDVLAILSAGAYGASMSSNYNSRPRPAEVLIDGDSFRVIRERETLASLIEREF